MITLPIHTITPPIHMITLPIHMITPPIHMITPPIHIHSSHSHDLVNNIEGFTSVSFETSEPFSLRKFQNFLDNEISKNIFRAKGIFGLWKANENMCFICQVNVFLLMIMNGKMKNQIKLY